MAGILMASLGVLSVKALLAIHGCGPVAASWPSVIFECAVGGINVAGGLWKAGGWFDVDPREVMASGPGRALDTHEESYVLSPKAKGLHSCGNNLCRTLAWHIVNRPCSNFAICAGSAGAYFENSLVGSSVSKGSRGASSFPKWHSTFRDPRFDECC